MATPTGFSESAMWAAPIKDLGLRIEGTALEQIVHDFEEERRSAGFQFLKPHYYLSTEWGVPFGTIAIAIPFYLAHTHLTSIQAEQVGFVEGRDREDVLRYLRHEFGHVVNYGYELYESEEWVTLFGSITQPYLEDYRPVPFSSRHVRHLPGWYAQKHPDEDWAETFAVWLTPRSAWRTEYLSAPAALAKLEYCERVARAVGGRPPLIVTTEEDENVRDLPYTVEHFYRIQTGQALEFPPGLDGSLRAMFDDFTPGGNTAARCKPAAELIRRLERALMANVYHWTGHFPEHTRHMVRYLAQRADELNQVYQEDREAFAVTALTTLVTSLAMNYVLRGTYLP